jgi:hypothetical protein
LAGNTNPLDDLIMGTEDAATTWGVSQDHIKRLCREGKCIAKQIGNTWVLLKEQQNPTKKRGRVNK